MKPSPFSFKTVRKVSKHAASKKNFKHEKRLSRGELNSLNFKLAKQYKEIA